MVLLSSKMIPWISPRIKQIKLYNGKKHTYKSENIQLYKRDLFSTIFWNIIIKCEYNSQDDLFLSKETKWYNFYTLTLFQPIGQTTTVILNFYAFSI